MALCGTTPTPLLPPTMRYNSAVEVECYLRWVVEGAYGDWMKALSDEVVLESAADTLLTVIDTHRSVPLSRSVQVIAEFLREHSADMGYQPHVIRKCGVLLNLNRLYLQSHE